MGWRFDDEEFEAIARSFENTDLVEVSIHSYRHRWGDAPSDPAYDALEARLADPPHVAVLTTLLHGADDCATLLEISGGKESYFTAGYTCHVFSGVGHCVQRERPEAVVDVVLERATAG